MYEIKFKVKQALWFSCFYEPIFFFICMIMVNYVDFEYEPNWSNYMKMAKKATKLKMIPLSEFEA